MTGDGPRPARNSVAARPLDDQRGGWYDRYGLQDADKCIGTYGATYLAPNGGVANLKLGSRDFLLQQTWVKNGNKGRCGMLPW